MTRYILGISAFCHGSAAVLVADGRIVAAALEERFTRIKQDSHFPLETSPRDGVTASFGLSPR